MTATTTTKSISQLRREANELIEKIQLIFPNSFISQPDLVRYKVHLGRLTEQLLKPWDLDKVIAGLNQLHSDVQQSIRDGKEQWLEEQERQAIAARKHQQDEADLLEIYYDLAGRSSNLSYTQQLGIAKGIFALGGEASATMFSKLLVYDLPKAKGAEFSLSSMSNYAAGILRSFWNMGQPKPASPKKTNTSRSKSRDGAGSGEASTKQKGGNTQKQKRR